MGWRVKIANPLVALRKESGSGSSASLSEQRIGCAAVGGGLGAVGGDSGDFGLEQHDAFVQLGLRIGAEVLESEATCRVSAGPGAIGFIHCLSSIRPKRLAVNRRDGYSQVQCS
jgi:hypothetical protein